jgi:hypothetical protein
MAESRPLPKTRTNPDPERRPPGRPQQPASRPAPHAICTTRRRRQDIKDRASELESDLSGDMVVGDRELDAIIRLLGDAMDDLFAGS